MKSYIRKGFFVCGALCFLSAGILVGYNEITAWTAGNEVKAASHEVLQVVETAQAEEQRIEDSVDVEVTPNYQLAPCNPMPEKEIEGDSYIGVLSIPDLSLELPVMSQWNYANLKKALCRYRGSVYLNNMVIAAHNYRSHFGKLHKLEPGNRVLFTDMDGNEFVYEVDRIETLGKYQIEEMEAGDWDLTLFTCTVGGENRVTIRCRLCIE